MAIITSGTPIKKVLSNGTPITKVISNGTVIWTNIVMITITIPTITGIASQTLKVGSTTLYTGVGGTTVQVQKGSSVILSATAASGYRTPTVTTPVTANSDFSTASYITAGLRNNYISLSLSGGNMFANATYAVTSKVTVTVYSVGNDISINIKIPNGSTGSIGVSAQFQTDWVITSISPTYDSTYYYLK